MTGPGEGQGALSDITLLAWAEAAGPGARLAYHTGFLVVDVAEALSRLRGEELNRLRAVAAAACRLSDAGRVHLVQQRLGPDRFSYLAIVRPRRGAAAVRVADLVTAG